MTKVNTLVLDLWADLLKQIRGSRLILSWRTLTDPHERDRYAGYFADRGIPSSRLVLTPGPGSHAGVLAQYGEVDIALDPFPFTGCLTTCEALWMGVPVITLPGTRPASRQSLGFLKVIDRTEWVARDRDDYIRLAAELASDPRRLAVYRRQQRSRVAASPLCNAERFTRNFEAALRSMWRRWCFDESEPRQQRDTICGVQ